MWAKNSISSHNKSYTECTKKKVQKEILVPRYESLPFNIYLEMAYKKVMLRWMTDEDGFLSWTLKITYLHDGRVDL